MRPPGTGATLAWSNSLGVEVLLRMLVAAGALAVAGVLVQGAGASQLVDRNARDVSLAVNARGEALITYRDSGGVHHVLAWGAVNAIAPTRARTQVAFRLDYSGGYGTYHRTYWETFGHGCGRYDGPALAWLVKACKAPDGSYWALQAWQRDLPDYGVAPTATQASWELRLSHWTGALPVLTIAEDWAYRRFDKIFGTFTYDGRGVYGFRSTTGGVPLDTFGRNVYVDTFDSALGSGWRRDNSFLTHLPGGSFCYGFFPHGSHPAGRGQKYRATVEGPGVTPDVMWQGSALRSFDAAAHAQASQQESELGDPRCRPN